MKIREVSSCCWQGRLPLLRSWLDLSLPDLLSAYLFTSLHIHHSSLFFAILRYCVLWSQRARTRRILGLNRCSNRWQIFEAFSAARCAAPFIMWIGIPQPAVTVQSPFPFEGSFNRLQVSGSMYLRSSSDHSRKQTSWGHIRSDLASTAYTPGKATMWGLCDLSLLADRCLLQLSAKKIPYPKMTLSLIMPSNLVTLDSGNPAIARR